MIIQGYYEERPTFWDNATQVQWTRIEWELSRKKNFDGMNIVDWAQSQIQPDDPDVEDGVYPMVKYLTWVDRSTGIATGLMSLESVFILNDEGKTLARV